MPLANNYRLQCLFRVPPFWWRLDCLDNNLDRPTDRPTDRQTNKTSSCWRYCGHWWLWGYCYLSSVGRRYKLKLDLRLKCCQFKNFLRMTAQRNQQTYSSRVQSLTWQRKPTLPITYNFLDFLIIFIFASYCWRFPCALQDIMHVCMYAFPWPITFVSHGIHTIAM